MTTPTPGAPQTGTKGIVALLGSLLVAVLPLIGQIAGALPAPYGAIFSGIGGLLSLFTGAATYGVSNKPKV